MVFANAIYLWGLLGLLIPIAIHLWSRKKVKTIKVGSTKLLEASEPKQTSSIKLNELWLLLLRLLTILLLVFIMAEPSITSMEENTAISYLVESSLVNDERMRSILDTISKESVRILESGFPKWNDYDFSKLSNTPSYWQLAREMQFIPSDSIVIFSRGFRKGLKGKRPKIKTNTHWIVVESNEINQNLTEAKEKDAYAEVLTMSSNTNSLSFKKDSISFDSDLIEFNTQKDSIRLLTSDSKDWIALKKDIPIKIGILENDSLSNQVQFIQAAYRGISRFLDRPLKIEVLNDIKDIEDFNTLITFDHTLTLETQANVISYQPDTFASQLITEGPTQNLFHLTELLNSENIVKEHLPEKLLKLLNQRAGLERTIRMSDVRTVAENELQPLKSEVKLIKNTAGLVQMTSWLWLALILVIILERIVSKLRKQ
ncbi:hypothetical protein FEE95_17825 [Maribacter algarum]|uniref:Aerotolerance regulator N-terminal domain-containing protein n=1 Tax=Maribacter algarum (ex Zhang et al. 2020) TaxID=2578118 RepID=A0A5S3PHL9_9FLAO|nr:BatA domain-containing protein [Maribacter algarum]TMM53758.1 hypothetical protein FEE95_17825 [Maribacter algarum]